MTDRTTFLMPAAAYQDCIIAVTETRNVTGRLGPDELRALRVLGAAGMVSSQAGAAVRPATRSRNAVAVFAHAKAS